MKIWDFHAVLFRWCTAYTDIQILGKFYSFNAVSLRTASRTLRTQANTNWFQTTLEQLRNFSESNIGSARTCFQSVVVTSHNGLVISLSRFASLDYWGSASRTASQSLILLLTIWSGIYRLQARGLRYHRHLWIYNAVNLRNFAAMWLEYGLQEAFTASSRLIQRWQGKPRTMLSAHFLFLHKEHPITTKSCKHTTHISCMCIVPALYTDFETIGIYAAGISQHSVIWRWAQICQQFIPGV